MILLTLWVFLEIMVTAFVAVIMLSVFGLALYRALLYIWGDIMKY